MTEADVRELLMLIDANNYSDFKVTSIEATTRVWHMTLEEYPTSQVMFALKEYFKTGGHFAPKPSDLIEIIHSVEDFSDIGEIEAVNLVMKALSNSAYHSVEEFAKLPPVVQRALGEGGASQLKMWATDEKFNRSVVESNIARAFRSADTQAKNYRRMSPEMKALADTFIRTPMLETVSEVPKLEANDKAVMSEEQLTDYMSRLREALKC